MGGAAPKSTTALGVLAAETAFLFLVCLFSSDSVLVITDSWYVADLEVGTCSTEVVTAVLPTKTIKDICYDYIHKTMKIYSMLWKKLGFHINLSKNKLRYCY